MDPERNRNTSQQVWEALIGNMYFALNSLAESALNQECGKCSK